MTPSSPEPLGPQHDASYFSCGESSLDDWLRLRAMANQQSGASRTYVACTASRIAGYYALSNGSVSNHLAPGSIRRNMPDPIPVMLLGRLAVDRDFQGLGVARALLKDAAIRTARASEIAGIRALMVSALDDGAQLFYRKHGYLPSPVEPRMLFQPVSQILRDLATS